MSAKTIVYSAARAAGLFAVSRWMTQRSLRILCYHGFSFTDEQSFRPQLFQTPTIFRRRLAYLKQHGYRTLTLDDAHQRLQRGLIDERDIVITIDDGFYGVYALAAPLLEEFGFTATVYVTTYYVQRNNPVFRLALQYIFWKTNLSSLDCSDILPALGPFCAVKGAAGEVTLDKLIEFGETQQSEDERVAMLSKTALQLGVDFQELAQSRRLTLMKGSEISDLAHRGFDIQLHTHRHQLPEDAEIIEREIADNRHVLKHYLNSSPDHLCYPSGVWSPKVWPMLQAQGVKTATTCDPGLNYADTPPLGWNRFLDFESTPQVVFEADLSGFSEMPRKLFRRTNRNGE